MTVKVGDKIKIIKLDTVSQATFPQFAGTIQTVIAVDEDGDPRFATPDATTTGDLWVECSYGGEFEIVKENSN